MKMYIKVDKYYNISNNDADTKIELSKEEYEYIAKALSQLQWAQALIKIKLDKMNKEDNN